MLVNVPFLWIDLVCKQGLKQTGLDQIVCEQEINDNKLGEINSTKNHNQPTV